MNNKTNQNDSTETITEDDLTLKTRLRVAEANIQILNKRVVRLEEEMATCLHFMRIHAERMAEDQVPGFKAPKDAKA